MWRKIVISGNKVNKFDQKTSFDVKNDTRKL